MVMMGERIPMIFLASIEYPRSIAEGTGVVQRPEDRISDKLRFIGNPVQQIEQFFIHFKRNYLLLH